jgi:hypothetical protein
MGRRIRARRTVSFIARGDRIDDEGIRPSAPTHLGCHVIFVRSCPVSVSTSRRSRTTRRSSSKILPASSASRSVFISSNYSALFSLRPIGDAHEVSPIRAGRAAAARWITFSRLVLVIGDSRVIWQSPPIGSFRCLRRLAREIWPRSRSGTQRGRQAVWASLTRSFGELDKPTCSGVQPSGAGTVRTKGYKPSPSTPPRGRRT